MGSTVSSPPIKQPLEERLTDDTWSAKEVQGEVLPQLLSVSDWNQTGTTMHLIR